MGLVPWDFRHRAPAVLRTRSWRHWAVLFWPIDEGWWVWPPLSVTCTALSWCGHVLSMTRDALKWELLVPVWLDQVLTLRSASPSLTIWSYHIFEELDMAENPLLSICPILHQRGSSWALFFKTCNLPQWDIFAKRCHVDVAVTLELALMQTPNHEECCAIDIQALSDNLYNPPEFVKWWQRCLFGPCGSWHPKNCFLL